MMYKKFLQGGSKTLWCNGGVDNLLRRDRVRGNMTVTVPLENIANKMMLLLIQSIDNRDSGYQ